MLRHLSPGRLIASGLLLVAVVLAALWVLPSHEFIFLPDIAHPVSPLVTVPKGKLRATGTSGGIYFVDVIERKATLFERLFPSFRKGASFYPDNEILPCGTNSGQQRQADLNEMIQSQQIAAAVALRAAGYHVQSHSNGVQIDQVACDSPAVGKLQPTDLLVGLDGKPLRTTAALFAAMQKRRPGDVVHLAVRTGNGQKIVSVKTIADPKDKKRALIGISVEQAQQTKLPFPVSIDAGGVGGPSAGLAFTLDLAQKLGLDVDHGYRVAATGTIDPQGNVGPIGGIEQKTIGARRAHVDVFLVPAGENAQDARKYAHGLRIIPVETFRQALRALATLPPRR